jgi:2-polyprenyl-6-hydroxyphenyl methylase/3-demethylubiquinone-9 3-methyltransferase
MAEAIARRGARVTGIDPAREALAAARAHAAMEGLDIRYDEGSGEALPYADASFDAVVCVDVLEHVSDLDAVLTEVARVLRPGGWFLFDTINQSWLARVVVIMAAERLLRILPRGTHDPAKFVDDSVLRRKLSDRNFQVGNFEGLAPMGLDRRGDFTFGLMPMTGIVYIGTARKRT